MKFRRRHSNTSSSTPSATCSLYGVAAAFTDPTPSDAHTHMPKTPHLPKTARRFLTVLALAIAGLGINAAAAFAVGTPSFSAIPGAGPGGAIANSFWITATSNPNTNTGANNIDCYQSINNGAWGNVGGSTGVSGSNVTDTWQVTVAGYHQVYCTALGKDGSSATSGTIAFVYDPTTPSVWANLSGGGGDNGWYNSAPSVYETDSGDGVYGSGIYSRWCSASYNQGYNTESCWAETDAGIVEGGSVGMYYDSVAPSVGTSISGGSGQNGWYGSAPSVSPSASDNASGVWYDSCTGLSNGVNYVTCSATDIAGNSATDGASQINLDTQYPNNSLPSSTGTWYTSLGSIPDLPVSASEGTNYSGLTSLSCSNPNDGSSGNYSLSQGVSAGASLAGTYPTSDIAIGTNTITCTSTTGAGNSTTTSFTVLYDPQAPAAQISTSADSSHWYSSIGSIPGLTTSGTVGVSGVKSYICSGDGISSQNYASNTGGGVSLTGLNQGAGTITCTLTANNGLSATATQNLKLDTTTPTVAYSTNANSTLWYTNGNLPTVNVAGSTSGPSGVDHMTCNGDGLPTDYTITGGSGSIPANDLNQGTGVVTCSSTSVAGLTSSTASLTLNIDDTVPTANIRSNINPAVWYSTEGSIPSVSVSSTSGPSGITWITCTAPGVDDVVGSVSGSVDLTGLRDGADTITCTPVSGAGVAGTAVTLPVDLDSQTPTLTFAGQASQSKWYDSASDIPELDTNATTGPSGLASIDCSGDGITSQSAAFSGAPVDLTGLNQGSGAVTCVATSGSGLTSAKTFSLNLDSSTPSAAWTTSEAQANWYSSPSSVPAIHVAATAGGGSGIDHITCSGSGLANTDTISGDSGALPSSGFANGTNTVSCVPVSGAGVSGTAITRTILVDNASPAIALSGTDESTWYASAQTVTADASADTNPSEIQSVSCALDGGTGTVTDAATATQNVAADGVHTVTCQPLSGAGIEGQSATTTVKIDSQTPTLTQTIVPAGPTDPPGTVDVQVTATEANSLSGIASTSCSLDSGTPIVVSGTHQTVAVSSAGAHSLDCTATTGAGVTSADSIQSYTVNADPNQFSLNYGSVAAAWQSGPVAVPVALGGATAGNYRSLTCTVNGAAPTTINGTSGTVNVATSGTDKLDCYATGNNGADTAAIQQLVKVDNQTPSASWSTSTTATGDVVTLLGSEQTPLSGIASETCSVDGGAAQSANSATLKVTVNGNGSHSLACTITTSAGISANVNDTVDVTVPVPTPITDSAPDPGRWYQSTQTIVVGIPTNGPTVESVVCTQGGVSTTYPVSGSTVSISVPAPGGNVQCYDVDSTGAQSAPVTFPVHIDGQAPSGYFVQTGPTQAIASVSDPNNGPGIQTVTVQYQVPGGQWVTIPGTYSATSGEIVVNLPASLQQPGSQYSLQAIAVDNAGLSTVINTMKDGTPASSSVPNPDAGASVTGGLYLGTVRPGERARVAKVTRAYKMVTKSVTVRGHHLKRRVRVPVMHKRYVWQINRAQLTQNLTVKYHQTISLTGTLSLTSGQVSGQAVTVIQESGKTLKRLTATTDANGVFNIKLPAGASRTVTYTVAGVSHTVKIREHGQAVLTLRGSAKPTLHVTADGATGKVRYRLQQYRGGHWRDVGKSRVTNARGRAAVQLPAEIAGTAASHLRVVLATQPAWQYLALKERA